METRGIGYSEYQSIISTWESDYGIYEFLSVGGINPITLERLRNLDDDGLVWTQVDLDEPAWTLEPGIVWHGYCPGCKFVHPGNKCHSSREFIMETIGFFIGKSPNYMSSKFEIEYDLFCLECNQDGQFKNPYYCHVCEGMGYVRVDYLLPGIG
jgi:hypothetical protein